MTQLHQGTRQEAVGTFLDLLEHVTSKLRLLVYVPLLAGLGTLAYSFTITPSFTAITRILPPQTQGSSFAAALNNLGTLGNIAGAATGIKSPVDQYIGFLYSETIQDQIIQKFNLAERYQRPLKEDLRKILGGSVIAQSGKDGMIVIAATDVDPKFAADLANAHVDQLKSLLNSLAITEAQQRRKFFQKQLEMASKDLATAEIALKSSSIESESIKVNPTATLQAISSAQERITAQEIKLASLGTYLTSNTPQYQQALQALAAMKSKLMELQSSTSNKSGDDFIAKYRDYKYREAMLELYARQYEVAKLDEAREGGSVQVVDVAQPPTRKSQPKKGLMAVVATIATFSALLLWVIIHYALQSASRDAGTHHQMQRVRSNLGRLFRPFQSNS